MPSENQLVTVIVPIYNAEPYLAQCLESIVAQTHPHLEILLLNDGSTDGSLSTMEAFAAQDDRIRIIDKPNEGYGATCNRGLDEAQGAWIAIIEPDDWIEPGMFADMIAFASTFDEPVDIVKTPYWRITMPDTAEERRLQCSYRHRVKPSRQPFGVPDATHLLMHHPSIWSALYRRAFLDDRGIRFREYPGAGWADNPFLVETLCQTDHIVYLDKPYYCYREETPEKFAAFTRATTIMPLERWNDMMDVLERLGIRDERVLSAHVERGFTYLNGIVGEIGWAEPRLEPAVARMFERMDEGIVFGSHAIKPEDKRLFARMRSIEVPAGSAGMAAWVIDLFTKGAYSVRNNGVNFAWHELKDRLGGKSRKNKLKSRDLEAR